MNYWEGAGKRRTLPLSLSGANEPWEPFPDRHLCVQLGPRDVRWTALKAWLSGTGLKGIPDVDGERVRETRIQGRESCPSSTVSLSCGQGWKLAFSATSFGRAQGMLGRGFVKRAEGSQEVWGLKLPVF